MNIKPAQFEKFCQHPDNAIKCIVIFGTNEGAITFWRDKCITAICGSLDNAFQYCSLDMENISKDGREIYAEFHAQSLMGGRRIIVVKNANNNLTDFLKNMLANTNSENLLLLSSSSLNKKSSLVSWAEKCNDTLLLACYEERESDISEQVARILNEKGLIADIPTMQLLCSRLSPDSKLNKSEIDKLQIYLGERKNITAADIFNAISDVAGADFEDLCYLVANGNAKKSYAAFNRLLKQGEEPATIIRQIEYHFGRLLSCVALLEQGKSLDDAIKSLRPPVIFYRKNDFTKQLRIWNKDFLLSALNLLYECERDCKTTNYPAEQCAGQVILRLTSTIQKLVVKH